MMQAVPRGLFKKSQLVLVAGEPYLHRLGSTIPDGTIVGARGTHGVFAPKSALNTWLQTIYRTKADHDPNYPAYSVALAFLGLKSAYEKAKVAKLQASIPMGANRGVKEEMEKAYSVGPAQDEVIAAFEGLTFESPSGRADGARQGASGGAGHRVRHDQAGQRQGHGRPTSKHYPPENACSRPRAWRAPDWIKGGMKPRSSAPRTSANEQLTHRPDSQRLNESSRSPSSSTASSTRPGCSSSPWGSR